ncbi:MAG: imidazolonepropionase, partial [Elusimicrobia bacterium]|nr:imidazolonepropionase [Elusimicrobiota bacterium]
MKTLIRGIGQLLTMAGPDEPRRGKWMGSLGLIRGGALLIEEGVVLAAGREESVLRAEGAAQARSVDAGGRVVSPGFVDSHSHALFAGPRLADFEARSSGRSYEQIAAAGGGILSSVDGVRSGVENTLADLLAARAEKFLACGTTTLEVKSGYGLELSSELKMLRALKKAAGRTPLDLVPTFLGAHALPAEMAGRRDEYVERVVGEMLPAVARENLARFADVFCNEGYFTPGQARRILESASRAGFGLKIHAEQLSRTGASALAAGLGAVSVDHLDHASDADIEALLSGPTVAALVPGSNYFLGAAYPPARKLIGRGAAVALATDFNPGTCPCWDMRQIMSIACTQMKMTPAETWVAATINGACALGLQKTRGSLEPGKTADAVCWDAEDYRE